MRQFRSISVCVFLAMMLLGCGEPPRSVYLRDNSTIHLNTQSGPIAIIVEIMDNEAEWAKGMMGRVSLEEGNGMLFVFPDSKIRTFWMKNTLIPLDMIFIDSNRKIVYIQHAAPPCAKDPCPTFGNTRARYVLEANAGWALQQGVKIGDSIIFRE